MRMWRLAGRDSICGNCEAVILSTDPMMILSIPDMKHDLWRCQRCAGEPVPENLGERPVITSSPEERPMTRLGLSVKALPRDFKVAQGGKE